MLGKKKGHKEVENIIEEKVIVKIEPDYAESSNNNYSSDDPQFDKMDCIKKEEEDDRDEGLYFDPQNLQVKVESLSDQELSDDYETMLYLPGSLHLGPHERALACRPPDPTSDQITLKCDECDFTSNRHSQLKRHKKYHARSEELRCPQCGHHFTTVYKMREHYRTHSGEKPYKCSLCPFCTSYPSSFKYHMRSHRGEKPYACSVCDFRSVSCTMLTRHNRVHTGEKPFECHLCDYRARAKGTLKSHLRVHTGGEALPCTYCDKAFVTSSAVRKHLLVHVQRKEHRCVLCDVIFPSRCEWKKHALTHGEANQCQHCGTKQGSGFRLKKHLEKSCKCGPFKCKYCNQSFEYKCAFQKHVGEHEESKPFKCDTCAYRGPSSASLRFHTRTKHTLLQPKKFECADCSVR